MHGLHGALGGLVDAVNRVRGISIRVRGLVQGVGFRLTVWRIAKRLGLTGNVMNDSEGVLIRAFGYPAALVEFEVALASEAPSLARIDTIETAPLTGRPPADFRIVASRSGAVTTGVVPDAATCPACLADIRDPSNRRFRYPFTNCAHCGPRLSILRAIPYDRASTSMAAFEMCAECLAEYRDPSNRRFHAQPNACPVCGPKIWLEEADGRPKPFGPRRDPIEDAAALIESGAIVAIKGIGGFHLACDARNAEAVARLRERKHRTDKPFALMARDLIMIEDYAELSYAELALLAEPVAPIVLLDRKENGLPLAPGVAPAQSTLGFMLPYTPLHHLLFEDVSYPLVMTSGNRSDEPQCIENEEARARLAGVADAFLMHDRDIVNRLDDSVARLMAGKPRVMRRARGYAPSPLPLPQDFGRAPRILGLGAELKSTFCLLGKGRAIVSQHMGDLEDAATHADYRANLKLYQEIFRFEPRLIAGDAHPEYHSTEWGQSIAREAGLPVETVHHHHAHVAAVIAEHGLPLAINPVIGIALDGLGLGERGELWGGEFLLAGYRSSRRVAAFTPVPLIGGAKAMREPWRNALAHLHTFLGWERVEKHYSDVEAIRRLKRKPVATALQMMERGLNAPPSSSAGRLFDAVAALLGVSFDAVSYEGQAAIELEALAAPAMGRASGAYRGVLVEGDPARFDWTPLWCGILEDLAAGIDAPLIAARFHVGLAETLAGTAASLAQKHGCKAIVLCGGVFQNRLLLEATAGALAAHDIEVLSPSLFPAGDGAISLGQVVIAAARRLSPHRE
jgi:hydrogenase maturation protein HypF